MAPHGVLHRFEHTHLGAYLVGTFAVACLFSDSAQGLIDRYQLNRKWLLLYGALCFFAYLYSRPFIRVGLGSAKRGFINFSALYILWLCSAVFYHLPSLEQLGLDVRADVSMLIVAYLSSLAALAALAALHTAVVWLRLLPRRAYLPAAVSSSGRGGGGLLLGSGLGLGSGSGSFAGGMRDLWILLLLNSMIIAVACSTYHSFCGNGTLVVGRNTSALKAAVCAKWLHPILTSDYPRFASWMLYGEGSAYKRAGGNGGGGSGNAGPDLSGGAATGLGGHTLNGSSVLGSPTASAAAAAGLIALGGAGDGTALFGGEGGLSGGDGVGDGAGYISVDFPLDGRGLQPVPAGDVLSPVLSMWVTMVAIYIVNTLAGQPRLVQAAADDAVTGSNSGGSSSGGNGNSKGRINGNLPVPSPPASVRRTASYSSVLGAGAGSRTTSVNGDPPAATRKGRRRSLEIKRPISKNGSGAATTTAAVLAAAGSAARGAAAAAARRSLSSLRGLAASTGRLKRAASDYMHSSHPYLPVLLGQVRRGMAALEPTHLAAELAEATGLPPDLARELTRGSSFSALAGPTALKTTAVGGGGGFVGAGAAQNPVADAAAFGGGTGATAAGLAASYWGSGGAARAHGGGFGFAYGGRDVGGDGEFPLGSASAAAVAAVAAVGPPPQPDFLDMVPWYSGTSADLFKTLFDLMVSVKLFLGRFDMRTMQAATAASMADSFNDTPSEGDGFTYEHLDERPQLWVDFIADTGDGGNPTYAVAAALAAPVLTVAVPEDLPLTPPPAAAASTAGTEAADTAAAAAASEGEKTKKAEGEKVEKKRRSKAEPASTAAGAGAVPLPGRPLVLPRGDVLVLGGDLAYPNPSRTTYQQRLFGPFSDALPPPPHFHSGRLVVHKPDLPPAWGVHEAHLPSELRGLSPRSSRLASSAALRRYGGPTAFAIPGNHDWIDGLETFTREIQHKGWLGGWLLPQEKSYFALRLPAGWWLFGFDLALVQDIDMQQYRYFANVVEQRMSPEDQVILITHEPLWLLEWFWQRRAGANLRQLVRGHLRGRARLHLAGDLHFYMRHSWTPAATHHQQQGQQQGHGDPPAAAAAPAAAAPPAAANSEDVVLCGGSSYAASAELGEPSGDDLRSAAAAAAAAAAYGAAEAAAATLSGQPPRLLPPQAAAAPAGPGSIASASAAAGSSHGGPAPPRSASTSSASPHPPTDSEVPHGRRHPQQAQPVTCSSGDALHLFPRLTPLPHLHLEAHDGLNEHGEPDEDGSIEGSAADPWVTGRGHGRRRCAGCEARRQWARHPHDPQHLVVNGGGGAFLHPTHVFAGARFPTPHDPAADATAGLYAEVALPCTCGIYSPGTALYGGAHGGRIGPWLAGAGGWMPPRPLDPSVGGGGGGLLGYAALGPDGEYVCAACYPSPRTSMQLGRRNLHVFRLRNTRFDVIGGVFYFLLVVSVLPRCSHLAEVLEADTPGRALSLLVAAYADTLGAILGRSYLSVGALAVLFLVTLGLARGGGVGAVESSSTKSQPLDAAAAAAPPPAPVRAPRPLLAARFGGFAVQLTFAVAHCLTHVSLAIVLLLLLELGVETCIKYERLGADGPYSLYRWYRMYEEQHFPDPMGLRQSLQRWTLGLYPGVLQVAMSVYDVPELIAVARTAMCEAGGSLAPISRLQAVSYYAGMLSYYWLLATPAMGFVFGLYLYLAVCWCHVHYDEAFSSLREANCKSFCRLHIGPSGDLRLYTLALDEVPIRWQEDARWRGPNGGGRPGVVAHEAHYPSRWMPVRGEVEEEGGQQGRGHGYGKAGGGGAAAIAPKFGDGGATSAASGASGSSEGPTSARWRLVDFVCIPRKPV